MPGPQVPRAAPQPEDTKKLAKKVRDPPEELSVKSHILTDPWYTATVLLADPGRVGGRHRPHLIYHCCSFYSPLEDWH